MIKLKMFQEMFHKLEIDDEGNIAVIFLEDDIDNVIEELERLKSDK